MATQINFWNVKKKLFTLCLWKIWNMNGWVRKDNWVSTFLSVSQIHNNKIEYTICFWQRKAKAPSGEFHFASYFSFRPFIYTQHYSYIHMWALWKHIHIQRFNAIFWKNFLYLNGSSRLYIPSTIKIWKKVLTKAIWADKNGLVSGRLACTSSKTEILNKIGI